MRVTGGLKTDLKMDISIETYRTRIGTFVPRETGTFKLRTRSLNPTEGNLKYKLKKTKFHEIFIFCLVWLLLWENGSISSRSNVHDRVIENNQTLEPRCCIVKPDVSFWSLGLRWSYSRSKINILHYIYGNRRNLGYKYFSWNCDRGLLSKHKIEDVRNFATKHNPH